MFAFMSAQHVCVQCPQSEEAFRPSGASVMCDCEPPYRCQESNLSPPQEQVLSTAEPSPQPKDNKSLTSPASDKSLKHISLQCREILPVFCSCMGCDSES